MSSSGMSGSCQAGNGWGSSGKWGIMLGGDSTKKCLENISVISAWSCVSPSLALRGRTLLVLLLWHHIAISQRFNWEMTSLAHVRLAAHTAPFRWAAAIFLVCLFVDCFSWVTARAQVSDHQGAAFGCEGLRLQQVAVVASSMSVLSSVVAWSTSALCPS